MYWRTKSYLESKDLGLTRVLSFLFFLNYSFDVVVHGLCKRVYLLLVCVLHTLTHQQLYEAGLIIVSVCFISGET